MREKVRPVGAEWETLLHQPESLELGGEVAPSFFTIFIIEGRID
jgi:hypothetical protein